MISIRRSNFFSKTTRRASAIYSLETSAYLCQIAREIVLLTKTHVQETTLKLARRQDQTLRATYVVMCLDIPEHFKDAKIALTLHQVKS